jgi:hypothetical protein
VPSACFKNVFLCVLAFIAILSIVLIWFQQIVVNSVGEQRNGTGFSPRVSVNQ